MFKDPETLHTSQGKEELHGEEEEFVTCSNLKRFSKAK
jgi:hypothetical protein